jgi:hypothetical protein
MNHNYLYFRKVWDRKASFHLARMHSRTSYWPKRLVSAVWLAGQRIPATGAAPTLDFKGLKL